MCYDSIWKGLGHANEIVVNAYEMQEWKKEVKILFKQIVKIIDHSISVKLVQVKVICYAKMHM